jgi:hypothetical protein
MKGNIMNKKDVAIIAGPIVGALAYSAVIITTVLIVDKVKERKMKKAANKKDIITELMEEAQKN